MQQQGQGSRCLERLPAALVVRRKIQLTVLLPLLLSVHPYHLLLLQELLDVAAGGSFCCCQQVALPGSCLTGCWCCCLHGLLLSAVEAPARLLGA